MQVNRQCAVCTKQFTVPQSAINRGKGFYCSKSCASKAKHGNKSFEQRFWEKVDKSDIDGCWLWRGATQAPWGYGSFQRGVGADGKNHSDVAHRVSYELTYGPILNGLFVCHHCDNPRCVRPDHLFLGTHTDNMADMHQKGRSMSQTKPECYARGERQHLAKLTSEQVKEIKSRATGKRGERANFAREFGVSDVAISDLLNGKTWRHIS